MSKTFVLKRNLSSETDSRPKSLSRERSFGYSRPYLKSEFNLDGTISRCPVHGSPRNLRHNSYHGTRTLIERHHNNYSDWTSVTSMPRCLPHMSVESESGGSKSPRQTKAYGGQRHKDLKRKMIFELHTEIRKPVQTITLEEISDMDRITDMCLTTLKSMMESKKHRKYLHHMNNNALVRENSQYEDQTNNSDTYGRRQQKIISNIKTARKGSSRPDDLSSTSSAIFRDKDKTRPVSGKSNIRLPSFLPVARYSITATTQQPVSKTRSSSGSISAVRGQEESFEEQLTIKDDAMKILADIQIQMAKQKEEEEMKINGKKIPGTSRKEVPLLTPQEALACSWLRLSRRQILVLEAMIRERGEDPGIHSHSDVSNYDVFSEVHKIRAANQESMVINEREEDAGSDDDEV